MKLLREVYHQVDLPIDPQFVTNPGKSTFEEAETAADGLGARLAFRCPHREIGKTDAFTLSVVSDCHAAIHQVNR